MLISAAECAMNYLENLYKFKQNSLKQKLIQIKLNWITFFWNTCRALPKYLTHTYTEIRNYDLRYIPTAQEVQHVTWWRVRGWFPLPRKVTANRINRTHEKVWSVCRFLPKMQLRSDTDSSQELYYWRQTDSDFLFCLTRILDEPFQERNRQFCGKNWNSIRIFA
jgi:hypothetical protein